MASLKDIKTKPAFFIRKKRIPEGQLCKVCLQHEIVAMVKWGCDYYIFTDLSAKNRNQLAKHIHLWCGDRDKPPECVKAFKFAEYLNV